MAPLEQHLSIGKYVLNRKVVCTVLAPEDMVNRIAYLPLDERACPYTPYPKHFDNGSYKKSRKHEGKAAH
jgi:hypothetical protein